jgi:glycolate oxidase FAD binding subunit
MATAAADTRRPGTPEEAADLLRALGDEGRTVRPCGGGTKLGWGAAGEPTAVELHTGGLGRVLEHNEGDLTAVLQAGAPLADAQATFAEAGQMLAIDPPPPAPGGQGTGSPTVGGLVATADSGPLRHRYGGVRDLVVGINVALSDGTLAKAGGKVIKNVAGYDLGKLFAGSHGTLGLVVSVAVRLHPYPEATATAHGVADDAERLGAAAMALARLPLEADCLDVAWRDGRGEVLVRFGGAAAENQAAAASERLRAAGLGDVEHTADDQDLWARQRAGQRSATGAVVRVSGRPTDIPAAARAAAAGGGELVGRAALGLLWVRFDGDDLPGRIAALRSALAPRACALLDAPDAVRAAVPDPWGELDDGTLAVMRRVKERFDPARIFRPGAFVGGI